MPEEKNPMGPSLEPGTIDDISLPLQNGSNQTRIFRWMILQVGILNDNHVSCDVKYSRPNGSPFTLIRLVENNLLNGDGVKAPG